MISVKSIDWGSIQKKAKNAVGVDDSGTFSTAKSINIKLKSAIIKAMKSGSTAVGSVHSPAQAGEKFKQVLFAQMESDGMPTGAVNKIESMTSVSAPVDNGDGTFTVSISINAKSESWDTKDYPGQVDLALLMNNAKNPTKNYVYSSDGRRSTRYPGNYGYIDNAMATFMAAYASQYNVINISMSG